MTIGEVRLYVRQGPGNERWEKVSSGAQISGDWVGSWLNLASNIRNIKDTLMNSKKCNFHLYTKFRRMKY